MPDRNSKLVYSTERPVPRNEEPVDRKPLAAVGPVKSGTIVRLERKGRGGKSVTVIEGLPIPLAERQRLLKQLKAKLGTGGTVKDGSLEIQGDHCDSVIAELNRIGYKPKRSGG
jgi:translation initiation factor 1